MRLNYRQDAILRTADMLGGAILLATIYAMFPGVEKGILRRIVAKLRERKALAAIWCGELGQMAYLTVHGDIGRMPGVRWWIKDAELARRAIATGFAGRSLKMPRLFIHDQIAGLIAIGVSGGIAEFEREIRQQEPGAKTIADGYAWPERDRRIVIENERMEGQSPHRWESENGLADRIAKSCNANDNSHPKWRDEYLVILPVHLNDVHPDSAAELEELVRARVGRYQKKWPDAGWWSIDKEDLEADPVWHPFSPESSTPPRALPGIRSRRAALRAEHAQRAEIDRERKARRAALTPEERTAEDRARAKKKIEARKKNREREAASPPESSREIQRESAKAGGGSAATVARSSASESQASAFVAAGAPEGC